MKANRTKQNKEDILCSANPTDELTEEFKQVSFLEVVTVAPVYCAVLVDRVMWDHEGMV